MQAQKQIYAKCRNKYTKCRGKKEFAAAAGALFFAVSGEFMLIMRAAGYEGGGQMRSLYAEMLKGKTADKADKGGR